MHPYQEDQQFSQVFGANFDAIQAYCLRRLPAEEAADAVSEVFMVAWRRIDAVPSDESARLWLYGVARNVVRNMDRSSRRRLRLTARLAGLAMAHASDPETLVVAASEHRQIMKAYHLLSRADQEVLRLRLWEELAVADIATVLSCTEKAASKRYQRALARLERAARTSPATRMSPHLAPRGGEK